MSSFSERVRLLREEQGYTQQDVADRLQVSKQTVSQYERGVREPHIDMLASIADLFNVSIDYLVGRDFSSGKRRGEARQSSAEGREPLLTDSLSARSQTHQESVMITRYRLLDDRGKRTVTSSLDTAYEEVHLR